MRAAMKLATGVVPVALGVAMALVSGMAKADDKAAQPQSQPLTGAVSAKTTLPSVGHRPEKPRHGTWTLQNGTQRYSSSLLLPVGSIIRSQSAYSTNPDKDNKFGANEYNYDGSWGSCRISRVALDGTETLISDSGSKRCDSDYYYLTEDDIGHKIKIAYYMMTNPSSYTGYTANPTESLEQIFVTSQVVSGLYDVRNTKVSPMFQEIPFSDPKGIKVTVKVADLKKRPVTGLNVTLGASPSSSNPSDAKLTYTPSIDNGDGSYTMYAKSTHANSSYFMDVFINGTAGEHEGVIFWSFR